ncbi:MAG: hypothetical protein BWX54_01140 [Verrucomicrobia bacterium ADurb.Bin018]|nr:MAG: hypothetical protein BWX54_01140 [Verrucomicrobia bacterium ADurb.Bin018]
MKLKALFDFDPWLKGEEFVVDDAIGQALIDSNFRHFEVIEEPQAEAVDAPPVDKMVRKPRRQK